MFEIDDVPLNDGEMVRKYRDEQRRVRRSITMAADESVTDVTEYRYSSDGARYECKRVDGSGRLRSALRGSVKGNNTVNDFYSETEVQWEIPDDGWEKGQPVINNVFWENGKPASWLEVTGWEKKSRPVIQ